MRTTDYGRALLRMARFAMGMFAVQVAALVGVSVTLATDPDRGVTAGLVTLVICWTLLVLGELAWRRRLNRRDQRDWADGWARVEPQ